MSTYEDDATHLTWLPRPLRSKVRHLVDLARVVIRPSDAIVFQSEVYAYYGLIHRLVQRHRAITFTFDGTYASDDGYGDGLPHASSRIGRAARRSALEQTALFLPFSRFAADRAVEAYPPAADRMRVMHLGLDVERWPFRGEPPANQRPRVLFVGADPVRKGLGVLLDALDLIDVPCDLDVVCPVHQMPADLARRVQARAGAELHGAVRGGSGDLKALYGKADVFALPTLRDLSPWVVLEAMAIGAPVIATDTGGLADFVTDGETGYLVTPGSVASLAEALQMLLIDADLRRACSFAGRARIEEHFDARRNGAAFLRAVVGTVYDAPTAAQG